MAEALTRIPASGIQTPVLTGVDLLIPLEASGSGQSGSSGNPANFGIFFRYSDGQSYLEDIEPYLDALIQSVENTVASNIESIVNSSSVVNPDIGKEKDGDIRVSNNVAFIYANGAWTQLWPF